MALINKKSSLGILLGKQDSRLSKDQRIILAGLLTEVEKRGIDFTDVLADIETIHWPIDSSGYFSSNSGRRYRPTIKHEAFIRSKARYSAIFGGRGSGKSAAGAQKSIRKISQGESGAVINPDFENFKISTWPEFKEWIPWEIVVPQHRYMAQPSWSPHKPFQLTFQNGVTVICKGLRDEDSARGPNINWLWYDEGARDKTGNAWKIAVASVRIGKDPQAWITTTPRGKYHYCYEFFVEQNLPDDVLEAFAEVEDDRPIIEYWFATIQENRDNLDPGFYAAMLAAYPSGYLRDQEILGKFVVEGGSMGDRAWFDDKFLDTRPANVIKRLRFWDLAATEKKQIKNFTNDPDETVGTLMSHFDDKNFAIEDQVSCFEDWLGVKELIKRTAMFDGPLVEQWIEQEPGAGGKNQVAEINDYLKKELPGHRGAKPYRPEGDRVMLANIWYAEAELGRVYIVKGDWNEEFLNQFESFPDVRHDDKVTSVSGARINIAPINMWVDIEFLSL